MPFILISLISKGLTLSGFLSKMTKLAHLPTSMVPISLSRPRILAAWKKGQKNTKLTPWYKVHTVWKFQDFSAHSDFTWKQFWTLQNLTNSHFLQPLRLWILILVDFSPLNLEKLIKMKIQSIKNCQNRRLWTCRFSKIDFT